MIDSFKLGTLSALSALIPFVAVLINFRFLRGGLRYLSFYIFISLIAEFTASALVRLQINNLPGLHIYTILEFTFLGLVYFQTFSAQREKLVVKYIIIAFGILAAVNSLFIEGLFSFNSNGRGVEALILLALGSYYLVSVLRKLEFKSLERVPMFWVNSGIIFYFSGSFCLFLMSDVMSENYGDLHHRYWNLIHSSLNIMFNLLLTVALYLAPKKLELTEG